MLHISAMAVWVGGLIMLLLAVLPHSEPDDLQAVARLFSRVAFVCVVVLAVTGSYAAWRGIGTIQAIFTTTYGWLVVLKVVLFLGIVSVANFSRLTVQRRGHRTAGAEGLRRAGTERLRRAVIVEVALAIGVLVATSVLVAQPRGKEALAVAHLRSRSGTAALGGGRYVTVTIDPGMHGTVASTVQVSPGVPPTVVTATATLPAKQIGPIDLGLTANGPELYGSSGIVLPAAGNWVITLVVATSAFDATTTAVTIHLY
jgi:copper transport protein